MKKVDELTGAELDFWVAKADGKKPMPDGDGGWFTEDGFEYSPSIEWSDGGPIIQNNFIELGWEGDPPECLAFCRDNSKSLSYCSQWGSTALIAAMRSYVAAHFGEEVDDSQTHNL